MTIRPEDLTVSALPRSPLPGGIKPDAVADLLERTAWDYRTALKQARELTKTLHEQARRVEELEAQIASLKADAVTRKDPDKLAGELESTRRELEQLRSQHGDEVADEEAIGKALLAATRAGEEIAAEARSAAERITADAEARAGAILDQATAAAEEREPELAEARLDLERVRARTLDEAQEEAERILANARQELERLESYAARLRSLLVDNQRRFAELAESALGQLEDVDAETGSSSPGNLVDDTRATGREPSVSAVTGE